MDIEYILAVSITLQLAASVMAFRLIRLTGRRAAWSFIAAALILMAAQRCTYLFRLLSGDPSIHPDPLYELIGLGVSFLMAAGIAGIAPLIRERRQAGQAMRDNERYRTLIDYAPDAVFIADLETGQITDVNSKAELLTGRSREELIGMHQSQLHPARITEYAKETFREQAQKARPDIISGPFEHIILRADGTEVPVEIRTQKIAVRGKRLVQGIFRDVTERMRTEQALRNSERKLFLHLQQTILGVVEWDLDFRVKVWNPAAEVIFGYSRDEAMGRRAKELILPAAIVEELDKVWKQLLTRTGGTYNVNENITKDGKSIICEWFNTPLVEDEGVVTGVMSLVRDITEKRKTEQALRLRESELSEAQRLARIGSWDWDAVNDAIWWSDEYYRIYGFDPDQPTPNYIEHLKAYTAESTERLDAVVKRAMETGEPYEIDLELAKPTAETRWILARGEAKRNTNGRIWGLRGTAQDITGRRQAEEEIRRLNSELEQRVRERTAELEAKNAELENMNRLFVGRELQMIELKERIGELEQKTQGKG